jgi:hypothetical protein
LDFTKQHPLAVVETDPEFMKKITIFVDDPGFIDYGDHLMWCGLDFDERTSRRSARSP